MHHSSAPPPRMDDSQKVVSGDVFSRRAALGSSEASAVSLATMRLLLHSHPDADVSVPDYMVGRPSGELVIASNITYTVNALGGVVVGDVGVDMPFFSVYKMANQTGIADSTNTKIALDTIEYDSGGFLSVTNNRYTPTVPGWYRISGQIAYQSIADGKKAQILIYKNGALFKSMTNQMSSAAAGSPYCNATMLMYFNGTDYIELYGWHTNGSDATAFGQVSGVNYTYLQGERIR